MKSNDFEVRHDGLTVKYRYRASDDDGNFEPTASFIIDSVFPDGADAEIPIPAATTAEKRYKYEGVWYCSMADLCRACGYTRLKSIWRRSEQGRKYASPDFPWLKDTTIEEIGEFLAWKKERAKYVLAGVYVK